jgi:ribosomal protein S17E
MGRIKSKLIKRTAKELQEKLDSVSTKFEDNKKTLGKSIPSKKLRNKIAGYLVRIEIQKRAHAKALEQNPIA